MVEKIPYSGGFCKNLNASIQGVLFDNFVLLSLPVRVENLHDGSVTAEGGTERSVLAFEIRLHN